MWVLNTCGEPNEIELTIRVPSTRAGGADEIELTIRVLTGYATMLPLTDDYGTLPPLCRYRSGATAAHTVIGEYTIRYTVVDSSLNHVRVQSRSVPPCRPSHDRVHGS